MEGKQFKIGEIITRFKTIENDRLKSKTDRHYIYLMINDPIFKKFGYN